MNETKIQNAPDKIFLNIGLENGYDNVDFNDLSLDDVTWSQERIFPTDIEYVRKSSMWHEVSEVPQKSGYIVGVALNKTDGGIRCGYLAVPQGWSYALSRHHMTHWAYVEDLLPVEVISVCDGYNYEDNNI